MQVAYSARCGKRGKLMANKSTNMKITLKITSFILRLLLNITFYTLVVILIINLSKMAFNFAYQLYGPVTVDPRGKGTKILVQIKEGESTMDVASKLELVHAIKNKYAFYLKAKLKKELIMPGTYELSTDMTYDEIMDIITDYSASIIKNPDADGKKKP
ncbi:MAG: endolytic transglycosylase MltG [Clostridiales bacterium]|nr:endolytic transglycosylase MltG [Clostridiales bacterium]